MHFGEGLRIKGPVGEIGTVVNDFYLQGNLVKEAKAGMVISLPIWKKPNVLDEVFLTSSKYIGDCIREEIEKNPRKVMLTGSIFLHKNEKIIFKLSDGLNNIELNGPVVDMAKNRPLTKDTIYSSPDIIAKNSSSKSLDDMINDADKFVEKGTKDKIKEGELAKFSGMIYNIVLQVGIAIAVIVGIVLGIQFMLSGIDGRADVKKALTVYTIGCVVIFGAFGIWKLVVELIQQI